MLLRPSDFIDAGRRGARARDVERLRRLPASDPDDRNEISSHPATARKKGPLPRYSGREEGGGSLTLTAHRTGVLSVPRA